MTAKNTNATITPKPVWFIAGKELAKEFSAWETVARGADLPTTKK